MTNEKSVWEVLSKHPVTEKIEKKWYKDKNGNKYSLSYLSWAWAWGEVKDKYPDASYTVHDDIIYPNNTVEVRVSVTIKGQEHMMWLPVMDYKNNSKPNPTSRDISDARMRCLVKAIAMHGLGHHIYAGEDLPPDDEEEPKKPVAKKPRAKPADKSIKEEPKAKPKSPTEIVAQTNAENLDIPAAVSEENWDATKALISEVVKVSSNIEWLNDVYRKNLGPINQLKDNSPKLYEELMNNFSKRKSELKSKGDQS